MNENLRLFLERVRDDEAWTEATKAIADRDEVIAAAIAKAAELGIELTPADFEPAIDDELSDDELTAVAGGRDCFCEIGGGGTADEEKTRSDKGYLDEVCACVFAGYGSYDDNGSYTNDPGSKCRCACVQLGSGATYRFDN